MNEILTVAAEVTACHGCVRALSELLNETDFDR